VSECRRNAVLARARIFTFAFEVGQALWTSHLLWPCACWKLSDALLRLVVDCHGLLVIILRSRSLPYSDTVMLCLALVVPLSITRRACSFVLWYKVRFRRLKKVVFLWLVCTWARIQIFLKDCRVEEWKNDLRSNFVFGRIESFFWVLTYLIL
jgi:hypothetical protein